MLVRRLQLEARRPIAQNQVLLPHAVVNSAMARIPGINFNTCVLLSSGVLRSLDRSLNVSQRELCRGQPDDLIVSRKLACLCGFGVAVRSPVREDGRSPDSVLASYLQNGVFFGSFAARGRFGQFGLDRRLFRSGFRRATRANSARNSANRDITDLRAKASGPN